MLDLGLHLGSGRRVGSQFQKVPVLLQSSLQVALAQKNVGQDNMQQRSFRLQFVRGARMGNRLLDFVLGQLDPALL